MPDRRTTTFVFAFALGLPPIALAQESGRATAAEEVDDAGVSAPVGYRTPDSLLLYTPAVRDELKLTADQRKTFDRIGRARRERDLAQVRTVDEESRRRLEDGDHPLDRAEADREYQRELEQRIDAAVSRMLTAPQRARLAQVSLQFDGPLSFSRDDVLRRLNVDEDQSRELHGILLATRDELVRSSRVGVGHAKLGASNGEKDVPVVSETDASRRAGVTRAIEANAKVREDAMGKIARVLRKSQMDNYARLRGEPFNVGLIHHDHAGIEPTPGSKEVVPAPQEKADTPRHRARKTRTGKSATE